jgi:large conductance mechanosensitive channel protein
MAKKSRRRTRKPTQIVTSGTTLRIETPQSSRQSKPSTATVVVQQVNPVGGFVNFLREHAVVGLAVGFVIGQQAQTLVKQLVASFIDPLSQVLFGKALSMRTFTIGFHGRQVPFTWGAFAYALLNFIFVLAAIYFIVKFFQLDKLDKVVEEEETEDKT